MEGFVMERKRGRWVGGRWWKRKIAERCTRKRIAVQVEQTNRPLITETASDSPSNIPRLRVRRRHQVFHACVHHLSHLPSFSTLHPPSPSDHTPQVDSPRSLRVYRQNQFHLELLSHYRHIPYIPPPHPYLLLLTLYLYPSLSLSLLPSCSHLYFNLSFSILLLS